MDALAGARRGFTRRAESKRLKAVAQVETFAHLFNHESDYRRNS
jgi:hypothetical protein